MKYAQYDGEPKDHALSQLRGILDRVQNAIDDRAKVRFEITVRWMAPTDAGATAVTWSNRKHK